MKEYYGTEERRQAHWERTSYLPSCIHCAMQIGLHLRARKGQDGTAAAGAVSGKDSVCWSKYVGALGGGRERMA